MTLRIRVLEADTNILIADSFAKDADVTFGLNKSNTWSATFPLATEAVKLIRTGLLVEIYYKGVLIISGRIQDFGQEYVGVDGFLKVQGRSDLDTLFDYPADSLTSYVDVPVIIALFDLLERRGWRIGDISTWSDPTQLISDDLATSSTLVEQIKKLLEDSSVSLLYRPGEPLLNTPTLDVGIFNEESGVRFITPPAGEDRIDKALPDVNRISKLIVKTKSTDIVSGVEMTGGSYKSGGGDYRLSLREHLSQDAGNWQDPDYPIVEVTQFTEYVQYNKNLDPYPGGQMRFAVPRGTSLTDYGIIGDFSTGSTSRCFGLSFFPIGGRLKSVSFWITFIGSYWTPGAQATNFNVQVAEINPTTPYNYTSGNTIQELYDGTLSDPNNLLHTGLWTLNFPEDDDNLILEFGKRYVIRLGDNTVVHATPSADISFWGVATPSPLAQGMRVDFNNNFFSSLSVDTHSTIAATIEIAPVDSPGHPTIKQTYTQYSAEKDGDNNSSGDIDAAANALALRGRAFLTDHSRAREDWEMSAVGSNLIVTPGSTVFVEGTAEKVIDNPASQSPTISRFRVAKDLRVDEVRLKFNKDSLTASYKLLEGTGVTEEEAFVSTFDASKYEEKEKGVYYQSTFSITPARQARLSYGYAPNGGLPDAVMSDGRLAKTVTLSFEPATNQFSAALMHKPQQLAEYTVLDPEGFELLDGDSRASNLDFDMFYNDGITSLASIVTDRSGATSWDTAFSPNPYVNSFRLIGLDTYFVLSQFREQANSGTTNRRFLPGSFTIWGSLTGDFLGEEVLLFTVVDTSSPGASSIRTYDLTHGVAYPYYQRRTTFTHHGGFVGSVEIWMQGYRLAKPSYVYNYDVEMVADVDSINGVGAIIKVAPKKRDWSLLDFGTFGAYYLWR